MIMSSTCRNLLFDTRVLLDKLYYLKISFRNWFRWSWPRAFKLLTNHNDFIGSPRNKITRPIESSEKSTTNSPICHPPSFLPSHFEFSKKKYLSDIEKIYPKIFVSCIELVILTYFTGKCSKQNLSSDLNLKITLVENKRGEGINRIQWISAWTVWIANFPRADRLDIALPSHLLPSPFPEDFLNSFLSLRTHSMRSHLTFPVPRSKLLLPRLA